MTLMEQAPSPESAALGPARLSVPVTGLSCASCVARVERTLAALPGVSDVAVNLATGRAAFRLDSLGRAGSVADAVARSGYAIPEATTVLSVAGMTCASCVARVERALAGVPGVSAASVNLAMGRASVRHPEGLVAAADLEAAVRRIGYEADASETAGDSGRGGRQAEEAAELARDAAVAAILALPVIAVDMGDHLVPGFGAGIDATIGMAAATALQAVLATLVLLGPGRRFFRQGIPGLLRGHPDMNALVALGAGAAYLFSLVSALAPAWLPPGTAHLYFEAAVLIVGLILLGRWLEARARGRTGAAIAGLLRLSPATARVVRGGAETQTPVDALRVGDVVRVRPGERVAADGIVVGGASYVDESMVTGEPAPVRKQPGSTTVGGTINTTGGLEIRVGAIGADTMLARIVAMVEAAQGAKLPIQALVDRVTAWFVPAVLAAATLTFLGWLAFAPAPALGMALVNAIAVLIIACPCAMGLATPTSIMVGTGRAAELGILFRDGTALQRLRDVKVVAFDKTGTLTQGRPTLTDLVVADGVTPATVLTLAAALEARSEHPIARAIVAAAKERDSLPAAVDQVEAVPGFGISGLVGGRPVAVGARRFMERLSIPVEPLAGEADRLGAAGRFPVCVAIDGRLAGLIAVSDPVKPGAAAALAALRAQGLHVAMVTGGDRRNASGIAGALGIAEVSADLLPGGKVEAVERLRARFGPVAFVGDGINDAPALAAADVGIAIGTGTDIAVESADVVLMSGALSGVASAIALSRAVMRNIAQNLFWAFAYNVALIPVAAGLLHLVGGPLLSPVLAAGAMALSSVFVLTNALRLRWAGGP